MTHRHLLMTADAVGGVWTYALDLARALVPHKIRTTLAVLGPEPNDTQRSLANQIPNLRLLETRLPLDWCADLPEQIWEASAGIFSLADREKPDIVQLHAPALAVAARSGAPVISVLHSCLASWWLAVGDGPMPDEFLWKVDLCEAGLVKSDHIIVPSHALGEAVTRCYQLPRSPIVVHNGRAFSEISPRAMDDCVLTAGRLWDRAKNVETMDAIAARLTVPFKAAGEWASPNGEMIRTEHLCLLGQLDPAALARQMAARPIFVSAARYEPFGLAVLEAAAVGCPLVLSDIPTFRELWGDAALFVPATDDKRFAEIIEELIRDGAARLQLSGLAEARAKRYTAQSMARQMAHIYDSAVPLAQRRVA